jgi:hypothetical protein
LPEINHNRGIAGEADSHAAVHALSGTVSLSGVTMLPVFAAFYGFVAMFVLSSLKRNRREQRPDAPILALAGRGLMAASATGAALAISAAAWGSLAHTL